MARASGHYSSGRTPRYEAPAPTQCQNSRGFFRSAFSKSASAFARSSFTLASAPYSSMPESSPVSMARARSKASCALPHSPASA